MFHIYLKIQCSTSIFNLQGFCVVVIIATALGIYQLESILPHSVLQRLDTQIKSILRKDYDSLLLNYVIACGLGLGISTATIIAEVTSIAVRFLNFSQINYRIKLFLTIVRFLTFLSALFTNFFFINRI